MTDTTNNYTSNLLHPATAEYTFFSRSHVMFYMTDHITNINKSIKQISINVKGFKSYKVCPSTTVELN